MIRSYPERNPFPHQGTLSIEAAHVVAQPGSETQALPTLVLDPVRRLSELTARYLSGFTPSGEKSGLAVNLTGGHGSGKTHTIRYVMNQVARKELRPASGVQDAFVVYAKAEDADFLKVYSQIMHQVPLELLADLSLRLLGVVAVEQFGQLLDDPKMTQRAVELLRADPKKVNRLFFDRYLVGQEAARKELADEIYEASGKVRDFEFAYTYLVHPELGSSAHAWLLGERIDDAEMRKLGVTQVLDNVNLARHSLLLLATLFGRVGRPFVFFIDQYEKLVVSQDRALVERNVGLLRDLVDALPGKGILFVTAGNEEAWRSLTVDLRQRYAGNVVQFPVLSQEEATDLVHLYLAASVQHILEIRNWIDEKLMLRMGGHALPIRALVVSIGGKTNEEVVVTASADASLKVWDLRQGKELRSLRGHVGPVNDVTLTPDNRTAISASDDGTLRIWDVQTGNERLPPLRGHTNWVNAVVVSSNGRYVASGSADTTALLWDVETGRQLGTFRGHTDTIWDVAFTPDGSYLLTASADGALKVWDLATGACQRSLHGHTASVNKVQVTPGGRFAITASDDTTLRLWDLVTGEAAGLLEGHDTAVRALALSMDGRLVLSGALDQNIIGWDLEKRERRFTLRGTYRDSVALSFAPDSSSLIVSGQLDLTAVIEDADLFPFTSEAIHEMLRYGAGNIRRLLQICYQVFDHAFPQRQTIDAPMVERTLKEGTHFYFNKQMVQSQVEVILGQHGLTFQRNYEVDNILADLAVVAASGSLRLLIKISEALFKYDEATQALLNLKLARTVQTTGLNAQVLLVVLGYTSPEVTPRLTEFVHSYIVYDPESFVERFGEVLDQLFSTGEVPDQTKKTLKDLEAGYEDLRRRFEELARISQQEVAGLQSSVTQYAKQQAMQKSEAQLAEARKAWAQERRQIEEQIREVRKDQRQRELSELERVREQAERSQRERYRGFVFLYGTLALILLVVTYITLRSSYYFPPEFGFFVLVGGVTSLIAVALVGATVYFVGTRTFFAPAVLRDLANQVGSLDELDRLARSPEIKRLLGSPSRVRRLLRHANPHYRYAGAVNADLEKFEGFLVDALLVERLTAVRRALALQLTTAFGDLNSAIARLINAPEDAVYLVEAAALASRLDPALLRNLPAPFTTLAVLAESDPYRFRGEGMFLEKLPAADEDGSLALRLLAISRLNRTPEDSTIGALAEAYNLGLDRVTYGLASLPERELRKAITELSPFDEGGLGTYDGLSRLEQIDELYLFFRQVLFYLERDVFAVP